MSLISALQGLPSWKIAACKLFRVSGAVNSHTGCTCCRLCGCSTFTGSMSSLKETPPLSAATLKSTTSFVLLGLIPGQLNRLANGTRASCLSNSPVLFNTHSLGRMAMTPIFIFRDILVPSFCLSGHVYHTSRHATVIFFFLYLSKAPHSFIWRKKSEYRKIKQTPTQFNVPIVT